MGTGPILIKPAGMSPVYPYSIFSAKIKELYETMKSASSRAKASDDNLALLGQQGITPSQSLLDENSQLHSEAGSANSAYSREQSKTAVRSGQWILGFYETFPTTTNCVTGSGIPFPTFNITKYKTAN